MTMCAAIVHDYGDPAEDPLSLKEDLFKIWWCHVQDHSPFSLRHNLFSQFGSLYVSQEEALLVLASTDLTKATPAPFEQAVIRRDGGLDTSDTLFLVETNTIG